MSGSDRVEAVLQVCLALAMELPTISTGRSESTARVEGQEQARRGLWQRRTKLEKALLGVSCVALVACATMVGVLATSNSSSTLAVPVAPSHEETMPRPQPLVMVEERKVEGSKKDQLPPLASPQERKEEETFQPPEPVLIEQRPAKSSRLPVLKGLSPSGKEVEVCNTPECTLAAAAIIENMDTSVDPCDNFYQFACGSWINNNPVPEDSSRWAQFDVLARELANALSTILTEPIDTQDPTPINKAKNYYLGCMDVAKLEEVGVTPLTDFLGQFGGWPMTLNVWDDTAFDWQGTVAQGKPQAGASYLVYVWVMADEKDTFSTTIYVDQTSLSMPRAVFIDPDNYQERIEAYKTYMAATANILSTALGQDGSQVAADVEDVWAFEVELAKITTPPEERRSIDRMYNPMTVSELGTLTGSDWVPVLGPMFAASGVTVDGSTRVIVQEPGYMYNLTQLLQATSERTVSNYLMWRHVKALGDETTQAMRDASFQYAMVASGVTAEEPRSTTCSDSTNNYMGMAIGTKYVETYFSQQAKDEVNVMVEDLRVSFEGLLEVNEWMDNATKPLAMEKAEAIEKFIGYPDWYGNTTALETYYEDLADLDQQTHFANVLALESWWAIDELNDFGKPAKRDQWFMPPSTVNAYYMPEYNSITFPAGILQPPFYRANTLMALNYGGIGQVIGHEITHGFDDQGRQNDKDGNAVQWWTNATLEAFQGRAQCIVDQYDAIRLPELDDLMPDATLNGINTQGENIADNGGIREALLAYKLYTDRNGVEPTLPGLTDYTPMQLLFLSNANIWCTSITDEGLLNQVLTDPHSPSEYRVRVPMSNMKEFSDIWGCPVGSGMNPAEKCVVW